MNIETRKKYEYLKEKNKKRIYESEWKTDILFQECISKLKNYERYSLNETKKIFDKMKKEFPITEYGKIDWKKFGDFIEVKDVSELYNFLEAEKEYYILWNRENLPCLTCKLNNIVKNIDNVVAVDFDTWLLSKDYKKLVEFNHEGIIKCVKM